MTNRNAAKPATGNLLPHEESRLVYEASTTLGHVYGSLDGRVYDVVVNRHGKRSFVVVWSVRDGFGFGTEWCAKKRKLTCESKARAFFAEKLAEVRGWATEKRAA